jgi:Nif-specific regulatory protein
MQSDDGNDDQGAPSQELAQATRERDLYRQLVELGTQEQVEPFLDEALALIISITGARRGYIELQNEGAPARVPTGDEPQPRPGEAPRFSMARGCSESEVAEIREVFSSAIIAEAIATGTTIVTASAVLDPRFCERGSVRRNRIEAVLCAPIVVAARPLGVLYLQDREQPGPFSQEDRSLAEMFSRYLAVFADRLLIRRRRMEDTDPTRAPRRDLRADEVIGRSPALSALLQKVSLAAPLEVTVLLTGQSGTGKTQIAKVLHDSGRRAAHPFRELNCAAFPEHLIENELFGAVQGGHSGGPVEGKLKAARGGTLFLDEIGELALPAQAKLLQMLQSKEYYPLGSSTPLRADVRIIAATNRDLKAAVLRREFREDLLYRINVFPIVVPSLAERREDIAELAAHFCTAACKTHGFPRLRLSVGAVLAVEFGDWPGNVRELAHKVEHAAILAAGEGLLQIERRHLFPEEASEPTGEPLTLHASTRRFQKQLILKTLEETKWNVSEAATRLDVVRSHMYNLMKEHGIEPRRR